MMKPVIGIDYGYDPDSTPIVTLRLQCGHSEIFTGYKTMQSAAQAISVTCLQCGGGESYDGEVDYPTGDDAVYAG